MRPRTFGAKLLSPLISLMSKMMVKSCAKDLGDIATAAERDAKGERGKAALDKKKGNRER